MRDIANLKANFFVIDAGAVAKSVFSFYNILIFLGINAKKNKYCDVSLIFRFSLKVLVFINLTLIFF